MMRWKNECIVNCDVNDDGLECYDGNDEDDDGDDGNDDDDDGDDGNDDDDDRHWIPLKGRLGAKRRKSD